MSTVIITPTKMVADSQCTLGDTPFRSTKLTRVGDDIIGMVGTAKSERMFLQWWESEICGALTVGDGIDLDALVLGINGDMSLYQASKGEIGGPIPIKQEFFAIGSGMQPAMAAMWMGASPEEAIRIAAKVDIYTNTDIEVLIR